MRLELRQTLTDLAELRAPWNELVRTCAVPLPCLELEWLESWWPAFGRGRQLRVFCGWEGSRLVAVAPLAQGEHRVWNLLTLRSLGLAVDGSGDCEPLDLAVQPGYEGAFLEQLLDVLEARGYSGDVVRLNSLAEASRIHAPLRERLRRHGWWGYAYRTPASRISLPGTWGAYLASLAPANRRHVLRYQRRLERRHRVELQRCGRPEDSQRYLCQLFELHGRRWQVRGQPGAFADPARREFYRNLTPRLLQKDNLELWRLRLDGRTVAVQFAYRSGDTVWQLQEGFAPEHASERVGTILRARVLQALIGRGIRTYDYLGGFDAEKARWGAQLYWYRQWHLARAWSLGALYLTARRVLVGWRTIRPQPLWYPHTQVPAP